MAACGQIDGLSDGSQTGIEAGEGQICGLNSSPSFAPSGIEKLDGGSNSLSGAGATFPAPIYSLWASEYKKATGVEVAYQSIGSGGGVKQISEQTVDFGASDAPMKDTELSKAKGGPVLHIPTVLGAVVPTYKLKGHGSGLKFTGEVLGKIFAGQITRWDDKEIVDLNPDAILPSLPIAVVHRSDGSGTTDIWTNYLTAASPSWVAALGGNDKSAGKEVAWPVGIGGKGNEGVSAAVGQTEGAIGYVELSFAIEQRLSVGWVKNRAGKFVQPCIATVTAAAQGAKIPDDLRFSIVDADGPDAYPVSGATWLLVYENQTDEAKAKTLVNFLAWIMDEGEMTASTLNYAPISTALRDKAVAKIKGIKLNGAPVAA
ncbi:MAG: phosphate ABC transporter substrate-binding protein PstS [Acidobacteria bacterium]|nr:MAG: phosphate ABC transporter substrate-binding protein PstS [Acidobacteriota bacterium]